MKRKNVIGKVTTLLMGVLILSSCTKQDESLRVDADAYIIKKVINNETKTALVYFAFANQNITSASVLIPNNGGTVDLVNYPNSVFTFGKEPADSDYSNNPPAEGSYIFTVSSSKGETIEVSDVVENDDLDIPEITNAEFNLVSAELDLSWNEVSGADGYVVKIFDSNREIVFNGFAVKSNITDYKVTSSSSTGNWYKTAVQGETYFLQIQAFSYDADADASNYFYNLQEISIEEIEINWDAD